MGKEKNCFRNIIHRLYNDAAPEKRPTIQREFRHIYAPSNELQEVLNTPDTFCHLYETGGASMNTKWFLYHSQEYSRCFMIWLNMIDTIQCIYTYGYREDVERIETL